MKSANHKRSVRKRQAAAKPQKAPPAVQAIASLEGIEAGATSAIELPVAQASAVVEAPNANPAVLLPAHCCLRDTAELKASLLQLVDEEQTVLVDAVAVERIDTAALQVLASFARERMAAARVTEWRGLNENFLDAVRLLGLGPHLHIPAGGSA